MKHSNKTSTVSDYRKYRSLILSLSLFSLLVVSIMMLSLYVSNQLEKDTKIINTAFEQTSLLNKAVSDLYIINSQYNNGQGSSFSQKRLQDTVQLLDERVIAFKDGGPLPVVSAGSFNELDIIIIEPQKDAELAQQINTIWILWNEYKQRVSPALDLNQRVANSAFDRYQFYGSVLHRQGAIRGLNRINLHNLTDKFALKLQEQSDAKVNFLRLVQVLGIIITGLSLVLILFFIVRQLRRSDTELENAREEAKGILNTVQEGLFLIHKDNTIGSEYSSELESILETSSISGRNISEILGSIISEKDTKNLDSFIKSLFNPKVVAKLIMDLNPLKQLQVKLENTDGVIEDKYLSFNFYRVIKKGVISDILVSAKDITDKILLQKKLAVTENKNEEQVTNLISIMKVNPETLRLFLTNGASIIKKINGVLKTQSSSKEDFYEKINKMFISIHTLKGESSAIQLQSITEQAHDFENELEKLKQVTQLKGMSFLPLTIKLEKLITSVEDIAELSQKMRDFGQSSQTTTSAMASNNNGWEHLYNLTQDMAAQYNKKVDLVMRGLSEVSLNSTLRKPLNSILVHLIKNSLVHGIETPLERLKKAKSEFGRIDISVAMLSDSTLEVVIRDDGRGLDSNKIARQLVENGIASKEEIQQWSSIDINKHIFTSGFSTANLDMNAGRGIGLAAIYDTICTLGGTLKVKQSTDQYCQFSIFFPPSAQ